MAAFIPIRVSNPNILGNIAAGQQIRETVDVRRRRARAQSLTEQIFADDQRPISAATFQGQPSERGQIAGALEQRPSRQQLIGELVGVSPQRGQQVINLLQGLDETQRAEGLRENDALTRSALNALSLPENQRRQFVEQERARFIAEGRDVSNITRALQQDDAGLNNTINFQARAGLSIQQQAEQQLITPTETAQREQLAAQRFEQQQTLQRERIGTQQRQFETQQEFRERQLTLQERKFEASQAPVVEQKEELIKKSTGLRITVLGRERDVADILQKGKAPQFKAAGFAGRMESVNRELAELKASGFDASSRIEQARGKSDLTASQDFRIFERAKEDFITAQLREESGAAISIAEFEKEERKFFPRPGDGPRVIEAKRKARVKAFETMKNNSKGVFEAQRAISEQEAGAPAATGATQQAPQQIGRFTIETIQ